MISGRILLLSLTLSVLSGCWVDEAQPAKEQTLHIVADRFSAEDSTVIARFAKRYHVAVETELLQPAAILQRVRTNRFNAEIDILITEDQQLRQQLRELKALQAIRSETIFSRLERQFNNRHHYWIPVSHDPLIVTSPKDTSNACPAIDFRSWHRNDSLRPVLAVKKHKDSYLALLASSHMSRIAGSNRSRFSNESVYALSELVDMHNRRDSLYHRNAHACRSFLIDNQRYVSRINTISIYRYGRNSGTAGLFLTYFSGNAYAVASGRNQLPTRKNTPASWSIRSLAIR